MFCVKTFIKKNKVGNYLKHVREHYIRDDLFCGFESCSECFISGTYLSPTFKNANKLFKFDHYIILDTNIILNQVDILDEDAIGNVIILQTVLDEVKHRSLPVYKRLISIIDNPSRHFYIFINNHHKDTYIEQHKDELINDYNDRCIRKACDWYSKHVPDEHFVLVTDDAENKHLAKESGLNACSIAEYVHSIENADNLKDKLSVKAFTPVDDAINLYPPHLGLAEIFLGIKEGRYQQGKFRASRDNFLEGSVTVEAYDDAVIVQGREGLNRSIDGDLVAIEVFKKNKWISPSDIILEDESNPDGSINDIIEIEKEIEGGHTNKKDIKPTGKVVGIIRRNWKQYCGILQPSTSDGLYHIFVPADRKIPKVRIETRQAEFLRTQKIIVAIDNWPLNSRYANGHFVRSLGKIGDPATENEVILLEHDVPHSKFSEEVLSCLPKLPWAITEKDRESRVDLRDFDICSVDPPGCTDIDDALHCRVIDENRFEVGVHIADVSHFIRPGSALDLEAASRATTVYLVNKRIDMVPELLSSNLCSLRGGIERFAFSCIWEMDLEANILSTRFHKSIIKSKKAMTYEEAQMIIDDKHEQNSIAFSLRQLNMLAKILKKRRLENGALVLASPEVKVRIDSETHDPIDVDVKKLFETNSMVEEFMLLANISVAQKILQDFPDCAMLRRHPKPPSSNFDPLIKAGKHLGFDIKTDTGCNFAKSLDEAESTTNPYLNTMLRILATRCMLQAVYFPSGVLQKDEYFHYGLAVPLYTHFTSPIRRYADIIVHRLLAVSVNTDVTYPALLDKHKTAELCQNLNYRNRMAQYAGRASVALNTHIFFKGKLQNEEGYILYVRKNALQILIPRYGLECTLYLAKRNEDSIFTYNDEEQTQTYGDIVFHAFDPVTVRLSLDSTNIQHEKLALQLVKPYIEGFSVEKIKEEKKHKHKPNRKTKNALTKKSKVQ